MAFGFNSRSDLLFSTYPRNRQHSRPLSNLLDYDSRRRSFQALQAPKRKECYDWIFSSSTNVHVAIDKATFKTFTPFHSYALSLADQHKIEVRGIGTVELKIRCKPCSKADRTITLENVLYIPSWLCNILSDTIFEPAQNFEHEWTDAGVEFMIREKKKLKHWGFTTSFCGLDKVVLARKYEGRSPMLEDKDREVFSINLTWPQSQRDRWEMFIAQQMKMTAEAHQKAILSCGNKAVVQPIRSKSEQGHRSRLNEVDRNSMPSKVYGKQMSNLSSTYKLQTMI